MPVVREDAAGGLSTEVGGVVATRVWAVETRHGNSYSETSVLMESGLAFGQAPRLAPLSTLESCSVVGKHGGVVLTMRAKISKENEA